MLQKATITSVMLALGVLGFASSANAAFTLQIRVTAFDSGGTIIGASSTSAVFGPFATPPGVGPAVHAATVGSFNVVLANNISNENFLGSGFTSHTLTANITYGGAVFDTVAGTDSEKLVVEFIGIGYGTPPAGDVFVVSNASPSEGTLSADSVVFVSGVSNANAGLPGIVGDTSGLVAASITTQTGTMGPASTILTPNPDVSDTFAIANPFSFYQSMTFDNFTSTGNGAQSAGSVVGVPAPAGLVLALAGLPVLGGYGWLRRRKAVQTA
jgi:hypothetical protein